MRRTDIAHFVCPGAAAAALAIATGCATHRDLEMSLGGVIEIEAITQEASLEPLSDQPSLQGADRSHWAPITFLVPVDTSPDAYTPTLQPVLFHATSRAQGDYPTPQSAVELGATPSSQTADAFERFIFAGFDLPILFFRGILGDPWRSFPADQIAHRRRTPGSD